VSGTDSTSFRIAGADDIAAIRGFIEEHWRSGHVLARDESLLRWQHLEADGRLDFVVAERGDSILGILGFIDQGRFDPSHRGESVSLTTWIARTDVPTTGVGAGLVRHLARTLRPALISTIGVATPAQTMLRLLGYQTGTMDHHVVLNPSRRRFDLAVVSGDAPRHGSVPGRASVTWMGPCSALPSGTAELFERHNSSFLPAKSARYFSARFTGHPQYDYRAIVLDTADGASCVLVCRTIEAPGASVMRCVDAVGQLHAPGIGAALGALLADEGHEYLDIVHHASSDAPSESAGFQRVGPGTGIELPGFFEPFVREWRELRFAHQIGPHEVRGIHLFLADSDQDRPNRPAAERSAR
jgi:hypothetical protein